MSNISPRMHCLIAVAVSAWSPQ